jgi:NAD(P)-dependent dehydrogenase (short-subunit alcohol dehydrogenase family)
MKTVLITGANRGLGLEFTRQYAAQAGWQVLACCRSPKEATALAQLASSFKGIRIIQLDVHDHQQIDRLAAELKGNAIDILIFFFLVVISVIIMFIINYLYLCS